MDCQIWAKVAGTQENPERIKVTWRFDFSDDEWLNQVTADDGCTMPFFVSEDIDNHANHIFKAILDRIGAKFKERLFVKVADRNTCSDGSIIDETVVSIEVYFPSEGFSDEHLFSISNLVISGMIQGIRNYRRLIRETSIIWDKGEYWNGSGQVKNTFITMFNKAYPKPWLDREE